MKAIYRFCLAAVAMCVWGGPRDSRAEEYAKYRINGADVCCDRNGSLRIVSAESVLVSGTHMMIAAPGWSSSVSQAQAAPQGESPRREGDRVIWRGTIPDPKQGTTWDFEQSVEPCREGLRVSYAITPSADTQISEAVVFIDLPAPYWKGKSILLLPTTAGSFPVKRGGARHFLTGMAFTAVLGEQKTGQLCLEFDRITQCTVQDVRKGHRDLFQIYPRIAQAGKLAAGREYRLDITIIPNDHRRHGLPVVKVSARGEPAIQSARLNADTAPRFGRVELTCEVTGTWDNPFDPNEVTLDAEVTDPAGRTVFVPGFYNQDYKQITSRGGEVLIPEGNPKWQIRYTPVVSGPHRVVLVLRNSGRVVRHNPLSFVCTNETVGHGFVRVSGDNRRYFEYDDGTGFFAVGENVALIHGSGLAETFAVYGKLAESGGNLVRSWWCYGTSDLGSWQTGREGEGFGKINLANAWRIDRLVAEAERLGLHLMCCLETQQNLRRDKTWGRFTYNQVNGGPLSRPREFFTNEEAKAAFRARLRYIVARWGYSTAVFSWQFWNEVSACNEFDVKAVSIWHRDMARYLRSIDPWRHLIHTNFGNLDGYREVDGLPEMEVVSTNSYSRRDMGQTAYWAGRVMGRDYNKPYLLTEYGPGHHGGWIREDPDGVMVHNGLWGSVVSGSAGTAMPWGCYNWIDPQDFYRYWRPISAFVKGVPFHRQTWQPVQVKSFTFADADARPYYAGVFFEGWPRNYGYTHCGPAPDCYSVTAEGELTDQASLRGVLGERQQQQFSLTCPTDGKLIIHVPEISSYGAPVLEAAIDGKVALRQPLARGEGDAWAYWRSYAMPITKGQHKITVRNAGTGSLWTGFELTRFRRREGPDLDVYGMQSGDFILLWLRNPQFIWIYRREGRDVRPQPEGLLTLSGVPQGAYRARWLDTVTGRDLGRADVTASDGTLTLRTPRITYSAAAKIRRIAR